MHILKTEGKGYTYVQIYDTLYIHMQKEINKLLTLEIATKVEKKKKHLNVSSKQKSDPL